jgi:hypothetical protein
MAYHDPNGFAPGGWRGFVAVLDHTDPSKPMFQGVAIDDKTLRYAVLARQNSGSLEFLVWNEAQLDAKPQTPTILKAQEALSNYTHTPFILDTHGGHLSWQNPVTRERQIIAEKYAESALDYTGCIATCRVIGARKHDGMIARMRLDFN